MEIEKKVVSKKRKNTSNKIGKEFEEKMTKVFDKYIKNGDAYIVKIPTEFVMIRGKNGKVVSCFPKEKSRSLDYIGVLKSGKFITFEMKTYDASKTKNPSPFKLDNIKDYQNELCDMLLEYTDQVFYVIEVRLKDKSEVYIVHSKEIKKFKDNNERKSIPYDTLKEIGTYVKDLDILKYIS